MIIKQLEICQELAKKYKVCIDDLSDFNISIVDENDDVVENVLQLEDMTAKQVDSYVRELDEAIEVLKKHSLSQIKQQENG